MAKFNPKKQRASRPRKRNKKAKSIKNRYKLKTMKDLIYDVSRKESDSEYMSGVEELPLSPPEQISKANKHMCLDSSTSNTNNTDDKDTNQLHTPFIIRHHTYSDLEWSDSEQSSSFSTKPSNMEDNVSENNDIESESESDLAELYKENMKSEDIGLFSGNRIINLPYFLKQIEIINHHSNVCTLGRYVLKKEIKNGLEFKLKYNCDNCERTYIVSSVPSEHDNNINDALVWGALSTGIGYSQAEELINIMDIKMMSGKKFRKHELKIGETWEKYLYQKMKENGEIEKKLAQRKGHVKDGVPYITVIGDGGWCKRSYGHGMNSKAGIGVIIGAETNKVLFLGVRNSFCSFCAHHKENKKTIPDHICYKNYTGPATGMEQDIIVEGFNQSVQQHGLVYLNYIGDGDSSVYARLQERVSYGRHIQKIECSNHITRAFSDGLHKLAANTSYALEGRKVLTEHVNGVNRIERLVKGVRTAIAEASKLDDHLESCKVLRQDLFNALDHVCGKHDYCRETFCRRKDSKEENVLSRLVSSNLICPIKKLMDRLIRNSDRLVFNKTTNQAERLMSLVSKATGGKRVDYAKRASYKRRAIGAAISHSAGPMWHLSPWKKMSRKSPGKSFKKLCTRREKIRSDLNKMYNLSKKGSKRKEKSSCPFDSDYGPEALEPDMPSDELANQIDKLLKKMAEEVDSIEKREALERSTVGQHDNAKWRGARLDRLTASSFGAVVRRLEATPCHNLVKNILFRKELHSEAIQYGRLHEKDALKAYEKIKGVETEACGLFIHRDVAYLGASPDALVGSDGIVEIKCIPSIGSESFKDSIRNGKKNLCLQLKSDQLSLKTCHVYYYQIQGQLNITERKFCDFVVYAENDIHIERVFKDIKLWNDTMLPKLQRFYLHCIAPEIIDSRIRRKMRCRDPAYIIEAQTSRKNKKLEGMR